MPRLTQPSTLRGKIKQVSAITDDPRDALHHGKRAAIKGGRSV